MLALSQRHFKPLNMAARRTFIGKYLGFSSPRTAEIVEKQDEYKEDQKAPITILNKDNSPNNRPFNAHEDMPDFKILQWKDLVVRDKDLESVYTKEAVADIVNKTYAEVFGKSVTEEQYESAEMSDLSLRFEFFKSLQRKLGFDIPDHTITRSHNVDYLYGKLKKTIAARWSNERNPNAIVLRPEDFSEPNVYLNLELDEYRKNEYFKRLKKEASERAAAPTLENSTD